MIMLDRIRSKLRRILYVNSFYVQLLRIYYKLSYWRQLRKGTPIIVYTMSKVGSTSIRKSLELLGAGPAFLVHWMNPTNLQRLQPKELSRNQTLIHPRLPWLGEKLFYDIIQKDKRVKVITLVREPISRNISNFLNTSRVITGVGYHDANFTAEELNRSYIERFNHWLPFLWFDSELKPALGIDVYQYPFPKERGYLSIKKGNFELLILKLEIDDVVKERVINEFLGVRNFTLTRSNVTQEKSYGHMYANFKETLELPEAYVEIMCNSEYMRHFYTDAEIEATRLKWRSRVGKTELPLAIYEGLLRTSSRVVK